MIVLRNKLIAVYQSKLKYKISYFHIGKPAPLCLIKYEMLP